MAWNEPGSGKQRDPWRDNGGGGGGGGPSPDFDAILKRLRDLLGGLFGGGGGGVGVAILGVLIAWLAFNSFARINASETGVVLRFGEFSRLMTPGINFKFPMPIESVTKVDIGSVFQTNDQVRMLTKDENIMHGRLQRSVPDRRPEAVPVRCARSRRDARAGCRERRAHRDRQQHDGHDPVRPAHAN